MDNYIISNSVILLTLVLLSFIFLAMMVRIAKNKLFPLPCSTSEQEEAYDTIFETKGGRFNFNVPLAQYTRFRVGGPAQIFFRPVNVHNLISTLRKRPLDLPVTVIGMGSNLLIRDGGVPGIVIHLGKGFQDFRVLNGACQVEVGAGLSQQKFSKLCAKAGIGGLEFFCGIPGSIGGALRMNAGAHGTEVKDKLVSASLVDPKGRFYCLNLEDLHYSYRCCRIPKDWIFVSAVFQGEMKTTEEIFETMKHMLKYRDDTQPVNDKTAGCTFSNPDNGASAWKLISEAGCEGLRRGGAAVSSKHSNFLINFNSATALDLETLGNIIQTRVLKKFGFFLSWEVERIGIPEPVQFYNK